MNVKVLWWRYQDVSGAQLLRVYINDDQRAEEDLELARLDTTRTWELTEVPAFFKDVAFYPVHDTEIINP